MYAARRLAKKGFTLVEILIVVIILGILAAIVIPQFTSASTDARNNSLTSQVQTLRSQLELYKLQHSSSLAELFATTTSDATQWQEFTQASDNVTGSVATITNKSCGPYLQTTPVNNVNGKSKVVVNQTTTESTTAVIDATAGFVYNKTTGKFFGLDSTGKVYLGS